MKNIGTKDRIIRLIIGISLLIYSWFSASWLGLAVALFVLFEALASWCILYQLIGKNTCDYKPKDRNK